MSDISKVQANRIGRLRKALEKALAIIANDAAGPHFDVNPEGRATRLRWVAELEAEAGIEPIAQEQASDGEAFKSRSVLRREAAQRGEEPPEFSSAREGK